MQGKSCSCWPIWFTADDTSVPVKVDVYPGLPHAFGYFPSLQAAGKNAKDLIAGINWLLKGAQ